MISPAEPCQAWVATILIVDDDPTVTTTYARILKLEGFEVATALSAEAALELAGALRPDAVIVDMRMPIMSGLQFLRQLRARPGFLETPVAIITGDYFLSQPIQEELQTLGAFIKFKPLWLEELVALAKSLLNA